MTDETKTGTGLEMKVNIAPPRKKVVLSIEESDPALQTEFAKEMVKQLRALDTYGAHESKHNAFILSPLVLTKERKAEIPVMGDPDDVTMSRVQAYYNGLSALIEVKTGMMAVPMINISHEGFGRVTISIGKLLVLDKTLRDVHRFGFKSLEKMVEEADKLIAKAVELATKYEEVARL
jgi:probable nitrogen fixation protein